MPYRRTVILAIMASAGLFVLFHFDLIKKIPGFYCEGFGCIGFGIFMMISPVLIAAVFFIGGAIVAKDRRIKTGFVGAGIAFAFAALAVATTVILKNLERNRAVAEACREDPKTYCPETLYKCTVSGNVTTCTNPDAVPRSAP